MKNWGFWWVVAGAIIAFATALPWVFYGAKLYAEWVLGI